MTPLDHPRRVAWMRGHLAAASYDHFVVTSHDNIRWLTGFTGSNGWVLVTPDELVLITDGRYGEQGAAQMAAAGIDGAVRVGSTRQAMTDHLESAVRGRRVGFEGAHISYAEHASLSAAVDAEWTATAGVVEEGRRTKDAGEIERMERASDIADIALAVSLPFLHSEPTEAQFRDTLEAAMRQHGADGPSFDTIVAAGANAALPHHHPDETRIVEGMTVVIDFGALFDGYHSDMTRTFTMGDPTSLQQEVYGVVLEAQRAGVRSVAPGAGGRALDGVCRDHITAAGWGDWFTHGTGHGVGLQIHESPWLTQSYDDTLRVADVVTVEPGVYRGDFGGVRIEDMVVVTTDGCLPLTKTPKDSPCLPSPPTT
ncbi:MAG: Xaa-Pro aminopeptidase [Ilumatobacteraceae bacterium]|nr:Xaa-Pro aminopeptidase [Ilumatobacteraceae bacterium]